MSSTHPVLISGAADCFAKFRSDAGLAERDHGRTRPAFQQRFRLNDRGPAHLEEGIRRERARIVHELHDTVLQGFLGAALLLDHVMEQTPADSPTKPALSRALRVVRQAIEEGRAAMRGVQTTSPTPSSLEQAFSNLLSEVTTGRGPTLRIFVHGKPLTLNQAIQGQLFLIGREAVMNALRHSQATTIEVEVQYLPEFVSVFVRDNGRGINSEAVRKESDSHWGLRGMRERAESIGARFGIWSRPGAGTDVRVAVPVDRRSEI